MLRRFMVNHKKRELAFVLITAHPTDNGLMSVSIVPMEKSGDFRDGSLEVTFKSPVHDFFPGTTADIDAINELLGEAGIELWKVEIIPLP